MQAHPEAAELHVLVAIIDPHIPQVSLHVAVLQSLHVPPGAHAGAEATHTNAPLTALLVYPGQQVARGNLHTGDGHFSVDG